MSFDNFVSLFATLMIITGSLYLVIKGPEYFDQKSRDEQEKLKLLRKMNHPEILDPDFHMDAVICSCHDKRVKTIAPCHLCKSQTRDEQCYKCFKEQDYDNLVETLKNA